MAMLTIIRRLSGSSRKHLNEKIEDRATSSHHEFTHWNCHSCKYLTPTNKKKCEHCWHKKCDKCNGEDAPSGWD